VSRHADHLRRWAGVAVSLVALAAVVWWASRQDRPHFPTSSRALLELGACVCVYAVATLARGWRWHEILRRLGAGHRARDAYALIPVGYMGNTVLPARGGELLRTVLLAGRSSAGKREILGSIISERMLDAISLAILFVVLTWLGIANSPMGQRPALIAVGVLVLGAAGVWLYLRARRRGKLSAFADRVRPLLRASRPLLGTAGLALLAVTLLVWMLEGTIFWLVARSLSLDVSWIEGTFLVVLSAFFALIPAAPGYVGTFDAAVLFGLKALHVAGGAAVTFAILVRFVIFVPITVVGFVLFVGRYGGLRRRAQETSRSLPVSTS
jgi:glycosyltransferase 2 family protein